MITKWSILPSVIFALVFSLGCATTRQSADKEAQVAEATDERLFETYWQLVELNGEPFYSNLGHEREPHILFQELESRTFGSGGCNRFMGGFQLLADNRIRFSQLASTKMACPNLDQEQAYLRALAAVDNFVISQNQLTLNDRQMKPLARFQAVVAE